MPQKNAQAIPPKTLGYLIICVGIIVVIILAGILPLSRYNAKAQDQIEQIQNRIEDHKSLNPIYLVLSEATEKKEAGSLPNPVKTAVTLDKADEFSDAFRTIAGKSGLMTIPLIPDMGTFSGESRGLLYNAVVKGELANFRRMLIGLGSVSYIERIEEIYIRQYSDSMEFRLKIWIALKG
ncbi:MAG: hypothetical protein R6W75_12695 [Smithellaceae bacterium]